MSAVTLKRPAAELRLNEATIAGRLSAGRCRDPDAAGILMRLGELLNREVVGESGQRLGRVHDVRGELVGGRLRVTGLITGQRGILERYGIGTVRGGRAKVHGHLVIPWKRVARVGSEIVVRD